MPLREGTPMVIVGLLEQIIEELAAKDRREHELRMAELKLIENSSLRDEYAQQLLLDRLLGPIEKAQHVIQDTAKHAQYLAQAVIVYCRDHGLTEQEAKELATQLRLLGIKITQVESLHDLKFIYSVTTLFTDQVSIFQHKEWKYRLDHSIRTQILDPLNNCIATENNFKRRVQFMDPKIAL